MRSINCFAIWLCASVGVLVWSPAANADLTGWTTSQRQKQGRPAGVGGEPRELCRSDARASFADAVWSGLNAARQITSLALSATDGDVFNASVSGYEAYKAINETINLLSDKTSVAQGSDAVDVDPLDPLQRDNQWDTLAITFRVHSDDDPIGWIRASAPGMPATTGFTIVNGSGEGTHDAEITIRLRKDASPTPGVYPLVFSAKEKDCHTCLTVLHTVMLRVDSTLRVKVSSPLCNELRQAVVDTTSQLNVAEASLNRFLRSDPEVQQNRSEIQRLWDDRVAKAREGHGLRPGEVPSPPQAQMIRNEVEGRMGAQRANRPELWGACAEVAIGVPPRLEASVRGQARGIESLRTELQRLHRRLHNSGCFALVDTVSGWNVYGAYNLAGGPPAAVRTTDGVIRLFVVGQDKFLMHGWFDAAGTWHQFRAIRPHWFDPQVAPVAVAANAGDLHVLLGSDTRESVPGISRVWWRTGRLDWEGAGLGPRLASPLACAALPNGDLRLFGITQEGALQECLYNGRGLSRWGVISRRPFASGTLAAALRGANTVDVIARGRQSPNPLVHLALGPRGMQEWTMPTMASPPIALGVCSRTPESLDVFFTAASGPNRAPGIAHATFAAGKGWSGIDDWLPTPSEYNMIEFNAAPCAVPLDANSVAIFVLRTDGRIWRHDWSRRGSQPIPGPGGPRDDK